MVNQSNKLITGSEEWCKFIDLSIPAIKARVDSGARTSAIHALNIKTFQRNGSSWVSFDVYPLQNNRKTVINCEAPIHDRRTVKSSSGSTEKRYVIKTSIAMGEQSWDIELTLTNRDAMGYRMLLGREAMKGRLLVDPEESFMFGTLEDSELLDLYRPKNCRNGV
ncbi:ATP-dependent zinc protease [Aliamphritea spongicola]|nr:ATP-dependent zinc protease [Aliamphritea spongicola]